MDTFGGRHAGASSAYSRQMLITIGRAVDRWLAAIDPWSKSYGAGRSLLALSTMLTLIFTKSEALFGAGFQPAARRLIPFALFPSQNPEFARWSAVAILLIVASGWRPRVTALPHWWISASIFDGAIPVDGGDQIAAVLTLLLLPICLTDNRTWQWQRSDRNDSTIARITALSAVLAIRVQIAAVYLHAAIGKLSVEEWNDGTAAYYWLTDPYYGAADWLKPILIPLLAKSTVVNLMTWASIFIELLLFAALVMPKKAWPVVLVVGLLFHGIIGIAMGLITFSITMAGALILYLCPFNRLAVDET